MAQAPPAYAAARERALDPTASFVVQAPAGSGKTELLVRLFHEERPRVFDPQRVEFGCTCSADRVRQSLSIYSARDIAHMTTDEGTVTADCQFCGAHYIFDPLTLGFEAQKNPDGSLREAGDEGSNE